MRSIFGEEMDVIWGNYEYIMKQVGFKKMMTSSTTDLMHMFTLNYKNLFYQVKILNEYKGKSRDEVRYSELKLRRLVALWEQNYVLDIEGGVSYSVGDTRKQFPLFACQRPDIIPTIKTIKKLRAKCVSQYINAYNEKCSKNPSFGKSVVKKISNLRDLRNVLMAQEKFNENLATNIVKNYGDVMANNEVTDFSNQSIELE